MAFLDEVKARFSTIVLRQLTNDGHIDPATATVVDAKILTALSDAQAEFERISGFKPDIADPSHVAAVCQGVLAYLHAYKGTDSDTQREHRIRFVFQAQNARDVFTSPPGNTSALTPSTEVPTSRPVRPDMDRVKFLNYLPRTRTRRPYFSDLRGDY